MKLKYYMRGLGIGILITTLIFAAAGKKEKLTDEEIMARAKDLGMVMKDDTDSLEKIINNMKHGTDGSSKDNKGGSKDEAQNDANGSQTDGARIDSDGETDESMEPQDESASGNTEGSHDDSLGTPDNESLPEENQQSDGTGRQDESQENTEGLQDEAPDRQEDDSTDVEYAGNGNEDRTASGGQTGTNTGEPAVSGPDVDEPETHGQDEGQDNEDQDGGRQDNADINEPQDSGELVTFTIKKGMSSRMVSELLAESGLVEDAQDFDRYIIQKGKAGVIMVGTYELPKGSDYKTILDTITKK